MLKLKSCPSCEGTGKIEDFEDRYSYKRDSHYTVETSSECEDCDETGEAYVCDNCEHVFPPSHETEVTYSTKYDKIFCTHCTSIPEDAFDIGICDLCNGRIEETHAFIEASSDSKEGKTFLHLSCWDQMHNENSQADPTLLLQKFLDIK